MTCTIRRNIALAAATLLTATLFTFAQTEPDAPASQPTSDEVMQQLLELRQQSPLVEPQAKPEVQYVPSRVGAPAASVDLDRSVLGTAPGQEPATLLREGSFIISRHGRLDRSTVSGHVLFIFEADSKETPETPMILQECQLLETMEDIVQQRGDEVVFILSGEVHSYRGANYLLPTMMKLAVDQGNL
jgi:hypothetical protein